MLTEKIPNKIDITATTLKAIAILSMVIDHIGAILLPKESTYYILFRLIGRLAFPIFCFLIAEGAYHTKNIKRYALRLGIFAIISEVPFNLAANKSIIYTGYQNVFFTLFLGLSSIGLYDYLSKKYNSFIAIIPLIIGSFLSSSFRTDYGATGVLLIFLFYICKKYKYRMPLYFLGIFLLSFDQYYHVNPIQLFAVFSLLPICFYRGNKGRNINKYLFYGFYPIHLLVLYILSGYL